MRSTLLHAACASIILVQLAAAAEPNQPARRVLTMRPTRTQGLRIDFDYNFRNAPPPFENEPFLEGKLIARGLIPTSPPTPLIRNLTDRELYLNADHSRDFTAGSPDTYKLQCKDGVHMFFQDIEVFTERGALAIPYTIDMYTYQRGCAGWFYVRSGWSARFELDGRSRAFTIIDNLDGQIDAQDRLILRDDRSAAGVPIIHDCPVPEVLCVDGHAFRLDFTFKADAATTILEAGLTEIQLPTGELRIEAKGCRSLALRDDRRIVLLEEPNGTVSIPASRYRIDNCVLDTEPNTYIGPRFATGVQEASLEPGQTAALRLGLPLTNTIAVTRNRNLLAFKYQLVGAGGELYDYDNPAAPPAFRIYKGPVKIGSGSFGFG